QHAPGMIDLISGEGQRAFHLLIAHPPVAELQAAGPAIAAAILEKNTQRLGICLPDENRIAIAPAHADVGTDHAVDAAKRVGTLPCNGEGPDAAGAASHHAAIIGIGRKMNGKTVWSFVLLDCRQKFLQDEFCYTS